VVDARNAQPAILYPHDQPLAIRQVRWIGRSSASG
jgi:hypothetical protein